MPTVPVETLVFDLGGVVVELFEVRELRPLLRIPLAEEVIGAEWVACPVLRAFESGELSPVEFSRLFAQKRDVDLPPAEFLAAFMNWRAGFLPGAEDLLAALRPHYRLACLSNSMSATGVRTKRQACCVISM